MSLKARMERAKERGYITNLSDVVVEDNEYEAKRASIPRGAFRGENTERDTRGGNAVARLQAFYHGTSDDIKAFQVGHEERYDN
jgi:hypothetical protein